MIREDYFSAILSGIGAIPFVGEVADTAKLVKTGGKILDAIKGADKASDAAKTVDIADDTSTVIKTVKYPGNDPGKSPGKGFEWRGKSTPNEGKGNWYNPGTGERWNSDLDHEDPIGPHWDYMDKNGNKFRVFQNGRIEKK